MAKAPTEPESISISKFDINTMLRDNSKITFIGRETNYKVIYKQYKHIFENAVQVKEILENLSANHYLVIDETAPNSKISRIVFYYKG
jgi:hypothetical protein